MVRSGCRAVAWGASSLSFDFSRPAVCASGACLVIFFFSSAAAVYFCFSSFLLSVFGRFSWSMSLDALALERHQEMREEKKMFPLFSSSPLEEKK